MHQMKNWFVLGTAALLTLTACDKIKEKLPDSLGGQQSGTAASPATAPKADDKTNAEEEASKIAQEALKYSEYPADKPHARPASFAVEDSGTARLTDPTEDEIKNGKAVTSTTLSSVGAKAAGLDDSWIYADKSTQTGRFLVAAASVAQGKSGDMIRRIDLGGKIHEFDYDKETEGTQGAYILIPDEMRSAVPAKHIDSDGLFAGTICAFVPGPNQTIIALAAGTGGEGSYGFVLDPYEEAQAFTPHQAFHLPYASNGCRGVYSEKLKKLYVIDVARTDSHGSLTGVFVVDIYNNNKATKGSFYKVPSSLKISTASQNDFQSIDMYNDKLYLLSGNGRFDSQWDAVLYAVPLNDHGEPLFEKRTYVRTQNPIFMTQACGLNNYNIGQVAIVQTAKGPVALTSGTAQTMAWDISGDEFKKIDMNDKKPGTQGINIEDFGRGGPKFAFSPDGSEIIQLTHCHAEKNKIQIDDMNAAHAFDMPVISTNDLSLKEPIDIGYRQLLATTLKTSVYRPAFSMTYADFAVGPKHIALVGAAAAGNADSGLGAGGDIAIVDRAKRTELVFDMPENLRKANETNYGFKLAQGDPKFEKRGQHSYGIIWIP